MSYTQMAAFHLHSPNGSRESRMKDLKTRITVLLAVVGAWAIVYVLWHAYQQEAALTG